MLVELLQEPQSGEASTSWVQYATIGLATLSLILSVILGLLNRRTAKRALELSEAQEARRAPRLVLYLNDSVAWFRAAAGYRLLGFNILVTNPTDRPSALVGAELHVTYAVDGTVTTVKVPHISDPPRVAVPASALPVEIPARLDADGAMSGWFLFPIDKGLTAERPIDRYDVWIRDVRGVIEALQVTVLREVMIDEAAQDQA